MGCGGPPLFGAAPPPQNQEMNTFATLSVIFAFIFAPAGAIFGTSGSQIQRTGQPGRTASSSDSRCLHHHRRIHCRAGRLAGTAWRMRDTPPLATSTPGRTPAPRSRPPLDRSDLRGRIRTVMQRRRGPRAEWPGRTVSDAELERYPDGPHRHQECTEVRRVRRQARGGSAARRIC